MRQQGPRMETRAGQSGAAFPLLYVHGVIDGFWAFSMHGLVSPNQFETVFSPLCYVILSQRKLFWEYARWLFRARVPVPSSMLSAIKQAAVGLWSDKVPAASSSQERAAAR